jgi:hypothetical protein
MLWDACGCPVDERFIACGTAVESVEAAAPYFVIVKLSGLVWVPSGPSRAMA